MSGIATRSATGFGMKFSLFNVVGNLLLYGGMVGNIKPNKGVIKSKEDLVVWSVNKVVRRETNVQLVARRNAKKQILS